MDRMVSFTNVPFVDIVPGNRCQRLIRAFVFLSSPPVRERRADVTHDRLSNLRRDRARGALHRRALRTSSVAG
jgi:hypothetical protein